MNEEHPSAASLSRISPTESDHEVNAMLDITPAVSSIDAIAVHEQADASVGRKTHAHVTARGARKKHPADCWPFEDRGFVPSRPAYVSERSGREMLCRLGFQRGLSGESMWYTFPDGTELAVWFNTNLGGTWYERKAGEFKTTNLGLWTTEQLDEEFARRHGQST